MNSLSNAFPQNLQVDSMRRLVDKGTVLRMNFDSIDHPKLFIIVGETEDNLTLAVVYINSDINPIHRGTPELIELQKEIDPEDYNFLHHKSYIDCAELITREKSEIQDLLIADNKCYKGSLNDEQMEGLNQMIIGSTSIKGKHKKKFGFYPK